MNNILVIGSSAINKIYPGYRTPKDLDLIMNQDTLDKYINYRKKLDSSIRYYPIDDGNKYLIRGEYITEIELAYDETSSKSLIDYILDNDQYVGYMITRDEFNMIYPTQDILYTLKYSHRYLKNSPHFLKTMRDLQFLESKNAKIFDAEWLRIRESETYNYSHPKLNQKSTTFFEKKESFYRYNHDDLHCAVSYPNSPLYLKIIKDGEEVQCSEEKFNSLSHEEKIILAQEEAMVLTLERYLIPNEFKVDPYT
ncbi:MAG: hypothetical protein PHC28_05830 [Flavobacterium sp.]|uniref:DUF7275 domain-containing protein n=1 Tax=Flavobacterium sp. TaxID=239 RepID=UPI002633BE00|nr:hypothetical protein [Flavobacterium sp.]MDD5149988.1 hypothetical protein [Flavobacterium sp.]